MIIFDLFLLLVEYKTKRILYNLIAKFYIQITALLTTYIYISYSINNFVILDETDQPSRTHRKYSRSKTTHQTIKTISRVN
jgi:hypothetical protein